MVAEVDVAEEEESGGGSGGRREEEYEDIRTNFVFFSGVLVAA